MPYYSMTAWENQADDYVTMTCTFDGLPADKAILKMIEPITKLDPLTAEDFVTLKKGDGTRVHTLNGAFSITLSPLIFISCIDGEIVKKGSATR